MLDAILGTGLTLATGGGAGIIGAMLGIGGRLIPEVMKYFRTGATRRTSSTCCVCRSTAPTS